MGSIWASNLGRARDLCPLQNVKIHFGAHPACYSLGTWVLSQGQNGQGMWLTSQLDFQVKNEQRAMSPLPVCLYGTYRDNFTFFVICFTRSWM